MEQLHVLLATGRAELKKELKQLLARRGFRVVAEAEDGHQALRYARSLAPDLVIAEAELPGISGLELGRILAEDRVAPVLLVAAQPLPLSVPAAPKAQGGFPVSYVMRPLSDHVLFPAIESLLSFTRRLWELEEEVRTLREKLETRKLVDRAKGILMEQLGISEAEAHRLLQKQSMDRCLPLRKVAEAVILTAELKKGRK